MLSSEVNHISAHTASAHYTRGTRAVKPSHQLSTAGHCTNTVDKSTHTERHTLTDCKQVSVDKCQKSALVQGIDRVAKAARNAISAADLHQASLELPANGPRTITAGTKDSYDRLRTGSGGTPRTTACTTKPSTDSLSTVSETTRTARALPPGLRPTTKRTLQRLRASAKSPQTNTIRTTAHRTSEPCAWAQWAGTSANYGPTPPKKPWRLPPYTWTYTQRSKDRPPPDSDGNLLRNRFCTRHVNK